MDLWFWLAVGGVGLVLMLVTKRVLAARQAKGNSAPQAEEREGLGTVAYNTLFDQVVEWLSRLF